jgi:Zn-dependent protease
VLRALAHPLSFLVLLLAFVVGVTLHGWVQGLLASRFGDRTASLEGQTRPDPRRHVDPFGAVAVLLSGLGWGKPVQLPLGRGRRTAQVLVALSGPVLNLAMGVGLLLVWRSAFGPVGTSSGGVTALAASTAGPFGFLQDGDTYAGSADLSTSLFLFACAQLFLGALTLVPLPPLDGGRLLFALAPRTLGWQKAELQLVERNVGVVALLVLLLIPLGGSLPILPQVLDSILTPLVRTLVGG